MADFASIVLASGSPRRRALLRELFDDFEVLTSEVDEDALTTSDPIETAERLALAKARAVGKSRPNSIVIGGDTVVAIDDGGRSTQLAKPINAEDACAMLRRLGARTHRVITGVAIVYPGGEQVGHDVTHVRFRSLTDSEIAAYVATGEPMDKAGAYAIQGGASQFVERVDGKIDNVVGLPITLLRRLLDQAQG